jgi:hypothetical protein
LIPNTQISIADNADGSYAIGYLAYPTTAGIYLVTISMGPTMLLQESFTVETGPVDIDHIHAYGTNDAQFHYLFCDAQILELLVVSADYFDNIVPCAGDDFSVALTPIDPVGMIVCCNCLLLLRNCLTLAILFGALSIKVHQ